MAKLPGKQETLLMTATDRYRKNLPGSEAEEYLASRGLLSESGDFLLGSVDSDPIPEHRKNIGMLSIPYIRYHPTREWLVIGMKFRCVRDGCDHEDHGGGKYDTAPGFEQHLFNAYALHTESEQIAICEGELDVIAAHQAGVPAIGVPGSSTWQSHYTPAIQGYQRIVVLADGDEAGWKFGKDLRKKISNVEIVQCDPGEDVNSMLHKYGPERIRGMMHGSG